MRLRVGAVAILQIKTSATAGRHAVHPFHELAVRISGFWKGARVGGGVGLGFLDCLSSGLEW